MNRLISQLAVGSALLALAIPAFAQVGAGPRGGAGQKADGAKAQAGQRRMGPQGFERMQKARQEMLDKLNLNNAQKTKLKALDEKTAKDVQALRPKEGEKPSPEMREKMQTIMKSHRDGMEKILTKAQWDKLQELQKARREEMRKNRPGKKPAQNKV